MTASATVAADAAGALTSWCAERISASIRRCRRLLELRERVGREQRALDERADVCVGDVVRDLPAQRLGAELLARGRATVAAATRACSGSKSDAPAEPGDDVAPALGVRHGELAQPALGLAGVHQRLQHAAVVVRDALVLEDADDDRVGVGGGRCISGRCHSHGAHVNRLG